MSLKESFTHTKQPPNFYIWGQQYESRGQVNANVSRMLRPKGQPDLCGALCCLKCLFALQFTDSPSHVRVSLREQHHVLQDVGPLAALHALLCTGVALCPRHLWTPPPADTPVVPLGDARYTASSTRIPSSPSLKSKTLF